MTEVHSAGMDVPRAPTVRQLAHRQKGHRIIHHGPGDYRCECGEELWVRVPAMEDEDAYDWRSRPAAELAMRQHRHDLWVKTPEGQAFLHAVGARLAQ